MKEELRDYAHSLARSSPAYFRTESGFREVLGHSSANSHRFPVKTMGATMLKNAEKMLVQAQDAEADSSKVGVIVSRDPCECLGRVVFLKLAGNFMLPPT